MQKLLMLPLPVNLLQESTNIVVHTKGWCDDEHLSKGESKGGDERAGRKKEKKKNTGEQRWRWQERCEEGATGSLKCEEHESAALLKIKRSRLETTHTAVPPCDFGGSRKKKALFTQSR